MDSNKDQSIDATNTAIPSDGAPAPAVDQEAPEFKIEIRKLDVPVRPRGVLAE